MSLNSMSTSKPFQFPGSLRAFVFAFAVLAAASQVDPSSSPLATTNLICHTANPADCYPAIFSPTEHFQIVHDDQSIPPGLHVRMNLATGIKEARLNIPEPDAEEQAAIVVIDNSENMVDDHERTREAESDNKFVVQDAKPDYNLFDLIPENAPSHGEPEADIPTLVSRVSSALENSGQGPLVEDMDELAELAYDVELGASLMSNSRLTRSLLAIVDPDTSRPHSQSIERAVTVLGNALHNNPAALQSLMATNGHKQRTPAVMVGLRLEKIFLDKHSLHSSEDFYVGNRLLFLLSQLCQEEAQLHGFLERKGLDVLNRWHTTAPAVGAEREKARFKIRMANFLADHARPLVKAVASGKGDDADLVKACENFQIDPSVRYDTSSIDYTSMEAAGSALRMAMGGRCHP